MAVHSSASPTSRNPRIVAALTLVSASATFLAAEILAERAVRPAATPEFSAERAAAYFEFPRTAYPPPPPRDASNKPLALVIGNSHTYSLPSPVEGRPLNSAGGPGVLPDELAVRLNRDTEPWQVGLLAYPNFLPGEMLIRAVQLDLHGYRPKVVVLGLTWRNVARDSQIREQVRLALREPELAERLRAAVDEAAAEPHLLHEALDGEVRRIRREEEAERTKSHADRIDERLFDAARRRLGLVRNAEELRGRLYRLLYGELQRRWDERKNIAYSYDLVESDLRFNSAALRALLKWYVGRGASVVVYPAPERSDQPPLLDPARQEAFTREFAAWAGEHGITLVDARRAVPNEFWGYDMYTPDRSHFTTSGHRLLAEFLWEHAPPLRRAAGDDGGR